MQQLDQPLRAYYALTHQVSIQQRESRLNSDYSHGTVLEPAALFLRRVRRVVGRYHIYRAVCNALEQRLAVCG